MLCSYTGTDTRLYLSYRDAGTDRTLRAVPGGVYDITAPPGMPVPPPDGCWAAPPAPPLYAPQAAAGEPETVPAPDAPASAESEE